MDAAFAKYGQIAKTEHLLRVVDPVADTYRRQMNGVPAAGALRPPRDPYAVELEDDDYAV